MYMEYGKATASGEIFNIENPRCTALFLGFYVGSFLLFGFGSIHNPQYSNGWTDSG